jgi:hypothetical protein
MRKDGELQKLVGAVADAGANLADTRPSALARKRNDEVQNELLHEWPSESFTLISKL